MRHNLNAAIKTDTSHKSDITLSTIEQVLIWNASKFFEYNVHKEMVFDLIPDVHLKFQRPKEREKRHPYTRVAGW